MSGGEKQKDRENQRDGSVRKTQSDVAGSKDGERRGKPRNGVAS